MSYDMMDAPSVVVEQTEDGLFMAYLLGRSQGYALGETADEARDNLLDRYDLSAYDWADPDEAAYLGGGIG